MDPATDWVTSGGKGALDFDGSNDYVTSIGNVITFSFIQNTMQFGFSFWMKLAATSTRYVIVSNTGSSGDKGFVLLFENFSGLATNAIRLVSFRGVLGSPVSDFRSSDNAINNTEWHHVAITAAGNGNSARIFVDGRQLTTTVPINLNALSTGNSTRAITIASQPPAFTLPFGGQLDDFRLFRSPFSAADARQLWQLGRGNMPIARKRRHAEEAAAGFKAHWARRQSQLIGGGV
jgi:hypothetical protein